MLSKITIAASIAVASAMARNPKRNVGKSPYDEGTAYFLGACKVHDSAGGRMGIVQFHQEATELGEEQPTTVSARMGGLPATKYSLDVYDSDPMAGGAAVV